MRSFEQLQGYRSFDEEAETFQDRPTTPAAGVAQPPAATPSGGAVQAPRATPSGGAAKIKLGDGMTPEIAKAISFGASQYGIEEQVLLGVAAIESRFRTDIISGKIASPRGALGLMQFMPDTAKRFGIDPLNPEQAAIGAAAYIRSNLDMFEGDYDKAVAAYNWGEGNLRKAVRKWGDQWLEHAPEETRQYVAFIRDFRAEVAASQDPARIPLPPGVTPSTAGAGRGMMAAGPNDIPDTTISRGQINAELDKAYRPDVTRLAQRRAAGGMAPNPELATPPKPKESGFDPTIIADQFQSGVTGMRKGYSDSQARNAAMILEVMRKVDAGEPVREADDPVGYLQMSPEQRTQAKAEVTAALRTNVADSTKRAKELEGLRKNPNAELAMKLANEGDTKGALAVFMKDPVGILQQLSVSSAPNILPGLVAGGVAGVASRVLGAGAAAGRVAGFGGGSFPVEFQASISESLQDAGVDPKNQQAVLAKMQDPKFAAEAGRRAFARATVIAAADAAGGAMIPLKPGQLARNIGRGGVNAATEITSEMTGEAAAQAASGERFKVGDIVAEGLGAGPQVVGGTVVSTIQESGGEQRFNSAPTREAGLPDLVVPRVEARVPAMPGQEASGQDSARRLEALRAKANGTAAYDVQGPYGPVTIPGRPPEILTDAETAELRALEAAQPSQVVSPQPAPADAASVDPASPGPLPVAPEVAPRGVEPEVRTEDGLVTDLVGRQAVRTGPALTTTAPAQQPVGQPLTGNVSTPAQPQAQKAALLSEPAIPGVSQPATRRSLPEVEPEAPKRAALLSGAYTGDVLAAPERPFASKTQANLFRDQNRLKGWEAAPIANGWVLRPTSLEPTIGEMRHAGQAVAKLQGLQIRGATPFAGVTLADEMPPDTARSFGVARVAARAAGINIAPVNGLASDGLFVDNQPGTVFVAADSTKPTLFVVGHEAYHAAKQLGGSVVADFEDAVAAYLRPEVVATRQAEEEAAALPGQRIPQGRGREEVVADVNGAMWLDPKFWREVLLRSPDLFQKLSAAFMEAATRVRAALTRNPSPEAAEFVRDVDAVRKLTAQMWVDRNKLDRGAKPQRPAGDSGKSRGESRIRPQPAGNVVGDLTEDEQAIAQAELEASMADGQWPGPGVTREIGPNGEVYFSKRWADKKGVPNKSDAKPGVNIEIAPNPDDPVAQKWNAISGAQRDRITRLLGDKYIRKALDRMGIKYTLEYTSGGFLGETNPSIIIRSTDRTLSFERLVEIAQDLGRMLDQQAVIAYDENDLSGGSQTGFVKLETDRPLTQAEVSRVFSGVYEKYPKAAGFTLRDGGLVFGNFNEGVSLDEFYEGLERALQSLNLDLGATIAKRTFRSEYLETANEGDTQGNEAGRNDVWRGERGLGALQEAFREEIRREIEAAIEEPARSTVGLREGTEDLSAYGVQPGAKITVRELAEALDKRAARLGRISDRDFSDRAANEISETFAAEIAHQLTSDANAETGSGEGWYSSNWPAALRKLTRFFPELGHSRDARALFTMLLAVTSNGERVAVNLGNAITLYDSYVHQGIPLTQVALGTKMQDALDLNLSELEGLLSRMSVAEANEYLLGTITVSELNAGREKKISDYPADAVVPMATAIMGPKLGAFYANLMGEEGYLTMDLWWTRSFNRVRGNLLPSVTDSSLDSFKSLVGDPRMSDDEAIMLAIPYQVEYSEAGYKIPDSYKGNRDIITIANTIVRNALLEINQAPRGSGEREFMVRVVRETVKKLSDRGHNLTIADAQAALWYYEKRLYGELGTRERGDIGYEEAIDLIISDGNRPQRPSADLERFRAQGRVAQDVEPQILRSARLAEPAGRPGAGGWAGAGGGAQDARGWSKRTPQPGSVTVAGWHYGKARVSALAGVMYGSGIKGKEADRLATSRDRRIKSRVYFYINRDDGTPPPKEDGLGPYKYEQRLSNLYDPASRDPRIPLARNGANEFESAILDAGFDGYIAPALGMAVVLDATVPVNYVGEDRTGPQVAAPTPQERGRKSLLSREIAELDSMVPALQRVDSTFRLEAGRANFDSGARDALNEELARAGSGIRFSRREAPRERINLFRVDSTEYESATNPAYRMAEFAGIWTATAPEKGGVERAFQTSDRAEAVQWLTSAFNQDVSEKAGRDLLADTPGAERAAQEFKKLASMKGAFERPAPPPTSNISKIFKTMSLRRVGFDGVDSYEVSGGDMHVITYRFDGTEMAATILPKFFGDEVTGYFANTSDLRESGVGADFYQAAFAWAKANKVKLQPDDTLTFINTFRRTEQMLSAALRLGTTKWMNPHLDQRVYGWNDDPKTKEEDDANIARLVAAVARNLTENLPQADGMRYNLGSNSFEYDDGRVADAETEIAPLLASREARGAGIGRRTLARGLLARQALSGELDAGSMGRRDLRDLLGGWDASEPGQGRGVAGQDAAVRDRQREEVDEPPLKTAVFYSRRQPPPGGFSFPVPANRYRLDPESAYMRARSFIQDRFIRLREVQRMIAEQGGSLTDDNDAYLAEERSHGRVAFAIDEFKNRWMRPFVERAAAAGVDLDELSLFAYAMHAQERNAHIASINRNMPDGGSGMTNADAQAVLSQFQAMPNFREIEDLHNDLMSVTQASRDLLWNEGLISDDEYNGWNGQYQNYIPLRGFENVDAQTGVRVGGRGINVRGAESMRALGRRSRAGSLIENVIADYERAVMRAERNDVGRTFYRFVQAHQDPALWEIHPVRRTRRFDPHSQLVVSSMTEDTGPDTIAFKENGEEIHIRIHDPALLRTMRASYMDETGQFQRIAAETLGVFNGYLRNTLTRWNPAFVVVNTARDAQTANASVFDKLGPGALARFNAHAASAAAVSWRNERGNLIPGGEWDRWMTEFRAAGGATGGFFGRDVESIASELRGLLVDAGATVQPRGSTAAGRAIDRAATALRGSRAGRAAALAVKLVEATGGMSENMFRVAAYRTAREMGQSPAQAASIAKNLTTNFDRRGEMGLVMNSAYLFFNAALQGAVRTAQYARNPRMLAVASAGVAIGLVAAAIGAGAGEEDGEPYWDMIPDYVKERNLIIMLPPTDDVTSAGERIGKKGRYIKIPLAYGLNFLPVMGYGLADSYRHMQDPSKGRKVMVSAARVANAFLGSYNPLGGGVPKSVDEAWLMALPTVADIPYTLTQELDSFGRKAAPERTSKAEPDSERAFMSDRGTAQHRIARWLNKTTGGNEAQSGAVDVLPATIEGVVRYGTGGAGMFLTDALSTATQALGSEKVKPSNVPFLKSLYGEIDSKAVIRDFYDNRDQIERDYAQLMAATKMGLPIAKSQKNDALYQLGGYLEGVQKGLTNLRKWEVDAVSREMSDDPEKQKSGKADREKVEAEKAKLMRAFSREFRKTWGEVE